ncbi:MAG: SPOR domain-containing protein [Gammaproteobacteria bacterium]
MPTTETPGRALLLALTLLGTAATATPPTPADAAYERGVSLYAAPATRAAALDAWREAASEGHADAAFNLGLLALAAGDVNAAVDWLEPPAAGGDVLAAFALGTLLAEQALAADAPAEAARRWLEQAAAGGYAPAQFNLARLLARAGDLTAARRWLEAAAYTFAPAREALAALAPAADQAAVRMAEPAAAGGALRDWIMRRPPGHFTLQVAAGSNGAALAALLESHAGPHPGAWFLHRPDSAQPYTAVVGDFADLASAEAALAGLPPPLTANAPWIRRFATLQRELEALDATAD